MAESITTNIPSVPPIQSVQNQRVPKEGPKVANLAVDFSNGASQSFNLSLLLTKSLMTLVQGCFIDNSANAAPISVTCEATGQTIIIPAKWQGFAPLFTTVTDTLVIASTSTNIANVFLINVPMPLDMWPTNVVQPSFNPSGYLEVTDVALDAEIGANGLAVEQRIPIAAPTDRGGTITAGGTAQQLAAANANRQGLIVQNPVEATENLYLSVTGNATVGGAGNFADLGPGQSCSLNIGGFILTTAVSVNAATTGHRWYATEF